MCRAKVPYNAQATMLAFVGENCPEESSPKKYTEEYLNSLYEAKADWEDVLYSDENSLIWAFTPDQKKSAKERIKSDRQRIGQIKDEIILCKKMMKKEIASQEVLAVA